MGFFRSKELMVFDRTGCLGLLLGRGGCSWSDIGEGLPEMKQSMLVQHKIAGSLEVSNYSQPLRRLTQCCICTCTHKCEEQL